MSKDNIFEILDKKKTIDDFYDDKDYDTTHKFGGPCIIRSEESDLNNSREKPLTFLATIQKNTDYKCFDEQSVESIKEYISVEPKGQQKNMTRCICGMKHDELNINLLRVFDKNRDTSKCFAIGGSCLNNHFGQGKDNDYLLGKERCKNCKNVINRRHQCRPGLCSDCYKEKNKNEKIMKRKDNTILKFGKFKNIELSFKYFAENYEKYCIWLLEVYYDNSKNDWIYRCDNALDFCEYLLEFHYEIF